ncbi:hypothetical protein Ctob_014414 [Chrysochromulina tobinii]|uniref:Uncharacterized protein n=1 Tax=Chrysochromulina tobinii TaxID=1460289 RepID=A0A0M0JNJ4_9EUKA|nr:hypothetical protein Ctob_014414 [Chrysochromulina tobinii]|eukprot:KOO27833.1 hypothetical protein Ctob_014414 [Chrysochromulina sp. CCMP291]
MSQTKALEATASVPIGVLLASWFFLSAGFNDVTPRLMKTLESAGGLSIDLTLIELAITVAIAGTKLKVQGAPHGDREHRWGTKPRGAAVLDL